MRIPVKVDEVRCNRHGGEMAERKTDPRAAALYAHCHNAQKDDCPTCCGSGGGPDDELKCTRCFGRGEVSPDTIEPDDVDLCTACENRVLVLGGHVLTPRKRAPKS